jgi:hypothetical protein
LLLNGDGSELVAMARNILRLFTSMDGRSRLSDAASEDVGMEVEANMASGGRVGLHDIAHMGTASPMLKGNRIYC